MAKAFNNASSVLKDSKARGIIIVLFFIALVFLGFFFLHLRSSKPGTGATGGSAVPIAPDIKSVPGISQPPREYVKLVEQQTQRQATKALKEGTAAIPTVVRATYLDGGAANTLPGAPNNAACSAESLARAKTSGVTADELRCRGCSLDALKGAGYSSGELMSAGFSAKQLISAGFTAGSLREAGFSSKELKNAGLSSKELAQAGFTAANLNDAGFNSKNLKDAGYTAEQMRDAGVSAKELKDLNYSASDLSSAGYAAGSLKEAGFSNNSLKNAGFKESQITAANKKNCSPANLTRLRAQNTSPANIRNMGCTANEMKNAGFTAKELRIAGFSAKELRMANFSAQELKAAGFTARELRAAGFTATELRAAGFSARELLAAGFSVGELRQAGFSAQELRDAGANIGNLRAAGFTPETLKSAGFSSKDMKKAGFTDGDLVRAGFAGNILKEATKGAPKAKVELVSVCSLANLKKAHAKGVTLASLQKEGCRDNLLRQAGFNIPEAAPTTDQQKATPQMKKKQAVIAEVKAAQAHKTAWEKKLDTFRKQQAKNMTRQEYQDQMRRTQQSMVGQANDLFSSWVPIQGQRYVHGSESSQNLAGGVAGAAGSAASSRSARQSNVTHYKAGTILFAVLDTGINSDEPSPIMATIVDGKLKNSKILGTFQRMEKKVVLQFNTLSVPKLDQSTSINAVAIDQNTARTAMSTKVDNHYLLRYGTLFASSFASGLGQAIQTSGSSSETNAAGTQQLNFFQQLSPSEKAIVALGNVGQQFGSVMQPVFNTKPTVYVHAGTGIGILLMSDLDIPNK